MKVRNSKSDTSIENGQSVLAVIIYTSDGVIASITNALTMLLVLAFPATTGTAEAGTGSHTSLQPVTPTNGLISSHQLLGNSGLTLVSLQPRRDRDVEMFPVCAACQTHIVTTSVAGQAAQLIPLQAALHH